MSGPETEKAIFDSPGLADFLISASRGSHGTLRPEMWADLG
jgi:hypothetical protein